MNVFFIDLIFFIFTIFIFIKMVTYSWHEIHLENNLFGGVSTIIFTFISVAFINIMVWLN